MKPIPIATHLLMPTFSLRRYIAKIVVIIILAKLIDETSAKGSKWKDLKNANITIEAAIAMKICEVIFEVFIEDLVK